MLFAIQFSILMYFASPGSAVSYFGKTFSEAEQNMQQLESAIQDASSRYGVDEKLMKAVAFPEFLRYSYLSDVMETMLLEELYVTYGSEGADFSIGQFQMKPSFAEHIERSISSNAHQKELFPQLSDRPASAAERTLRLQRLQSTDDQLRYLSAFLLLAEDRFRQSHLPQSEKIRFCAYLYNRGLNASVQQYEERSREKMFPNGKRANENPFAYADIAMLYQHRTEISK